MKYSNKIIDLSIVQSLRAPQGDFVTSTLTVTWTRIYHVTDTASYWEFITKTDWLYSGWVIPLFTWDIVYYFHCNRKAADHPHRIKSLIIRILYPGSSRKRRRLKSEGILLKCLSVMLDFLGMSMVNNGQSYVPNSHDRIKDLIQ